MRRRSRGRYIVVWISRRRKGEEDGEECIEDVVSMQPRVFLSYDWDIRAESDTSCTSAQLSYGKQREREKRGGSVYLKKLHGEPRPGRVRRLVVVPRLVLLLLRCRAVLRRDRR